MRYVIQYRHPKHGWTIWHSHSLRAARRRFAKCVRKDWRMGSDSIRNVTMGWWETP